MTRWHAISPTREVLSSVAAEDIGEARTKLRATLAAVKGSYCQSAVSHALGINPVPVGKRCARCRVAERDGTRSYCRQCNSDVTYEAECRRKGIADPEAWKAARRAGRGKGVRGPDKRERNAPPKRPAEHRAKISQRMREVWQAKRGTQSTTGEA